MNQPEVITRRRLPHWYVSGAAHFVTYRLHGTLPQNVLDELRSKKETLVQQKPPAGLSPDQHKERIHKMLFADYDRWLDQHRAIQWLSDARLAALIRSNLYHHHNSKYHLMAYTVMSNHVHVLLQPIDSANRTLDGRAEHLAIGEQPDATSPLATIMHSLKSYTAHEANKILRRTGTFWQAESYDHWVRDEDELQRIVDYIAANPVRAGLVRRVQDWYFSSCHDRYLTDGDPSGWLH